MNTLRTTLSIAAAGLAVLGLSACAEEAEAPDYDEGMMPEDGMTTTPGDQMGVEGAPADTGTPAPGTIGDPNTPSMQDEVERGERAEDMDPIEDPRETPTPDAPQ